jgi:hypothetical protein
MWSARTSGKTLLRAVEQIELPGYELVGGVEELGCMPEKYAGTGAATALLLPQSSAPPNTTMNPIVTTPHA